MIGGMAMEPSERLKKVEEALKEIYPEIEFHTRELEMLKAITSDLVWTTAKLERFIEKLEKSVEELRKQSEADHKRLIDLDEWARKKWGEMANRLGTLTEDIFAPGIPHLVQKLGYRIRERMLDVEYKKDGRSRQYDAMVVAEDENGNEVLFVAEVKSQATSEDFDQLKSLLEDLLQFKPEYANKRIIPILAAFRIPEDLVNLASKRGVLLVRMGGEYLKPSTLKS